MICFISLGCILDKVHNLGTGPPRGMMLIQCRSAWYKGWFHKSKLGMPCTISVQCRYGMICPIEDSTHQFVNLDLGYSTMKHKVALQKP